MKAVDFHGLGDHRIGRVRENFRTLRIEQQGGPVTRDPSALLTAVVRREPGPDKCMDSQIANSPHASGHTARPFGRENLSDEPGGCDLSPSSNRALDSEATELQGM